MNKIIVPPEGKEDQARFRAEKDDWLLAATSREATKAVHRVAPFIFVHLNARRADFHWGVKGIAEALTMSVPQVERALKWLREHGLIAKKGRDGRHGTSIYALSLPFINPSLAEGSSELIDPSSSEGSTTQDVLSSPHFGLDDPSLLGSQPLNRRGTNPVVTPKEPEGCAPKAQQPSGSYLNPDAQSTESDSGDDGSPLPLGTGDSPGFEDTEDHFGAPSRHAILVAGETQDRKSIARDIFAESSFTENRMRQAARDRRERMMANLYA